MSTHSAESLPKGAYASRIGGDEFVAILENTEQQIVNEYIDKLNAEVAAYNARISNEIEKLSFASGYFVGDLIETGIDNMLLKADKHMLENKRKMKEESHGSLRK